MCRAWQENLGVLRITVISTLTPLLSNAFYITRFKLFIFGAIGLRYLITHGLELLDTNTQGKLSNHEGKNVQAQTKDWSLYALLPKSTIRQDG